MSTTIQQSDPLSPFISLTPSIYLVEPRTSSSQSKHTTIILSFWYSAPRRALVKYVLKYAELAPSARIIFILSGPRDFYLYPTLASHRLRLKPATDILVAHQQQENKTEDDDSVFIHLFSNGGLFSTAHLLMAYKHATGKPLRVSSVILDSSPGKSTPSMSIKALSYALPKTLILRQIGLAFIATLIWGSFVTRKSWSLVLRLIWKRRNPSKDSDDVVYGDDPLAFTRKAILDKDVIVAKSPAETVDMCYVYSDSDELVPLKDVEEHAALADSMSVQGTKKEVQLERFSGSPHVGHMRADPKRYWGIVERYLM